MDILLKEIIENRNRLLTDLKKYLLELKQDFKHLNPNFSTFSPQYKYVDLHLFIEANRYLINQEIINTCNSYILKLKQGINLKQSNSFDSGAFSNELDSIICLINIEIAKFD